MSEQKQLSLEELTSRKVELESKSKATGLSEEEKKELVDLSLKIVEVEDELEAAAAAKAKAPATKKPAPKAGAPAPEATSPDAIAKAEEGYVPNENEKHLFHVELTKGLRYDPATGKQIAAPYVQMFDRTAWNQFKQHEAVLGYTSRVLWDPTVKA